MDICFGDFNTDRIYSVEREREGAMSCFILKQKWVRVKKENWFGNQR